MVFSQRRTSTYVHFLYKFHICLHLFFVQQREKPWFNKPIVDLKNIHFTCFSFTMKLYLHIYQERIADFSQVADEAQ